MADIDDTLRVLGTDDGRSVLVPSCDARELALYVERLRSQLSASESAREKAEGERDEWRNALQGLHREWARGDGHGSAQHTADCIAGKRVAQSIDHADELREVKAETTAAEERATAAEARVAGLEANERHDLARIDVLRRLCHEAWRYIEHDEVNPGASRPLAERLQRAALESTDGK